MRFRAALLAVVCVLVSLGVLWAISQRHPVAPQTHVWPPRERIEPIYDGEIIDLRIKEILPADAAEYASNYRYCVHWNGEPAYDSARAAEIERGIKESCTGLEAARDSLQVKYPRGSSVDSTLRLVIAQIDYDSEDYVWNDPDHRSKVLSRYYEAFGQHTPERVDELIAERRALADTASAATRKNVQYQISVETRYLSEIMENIDRLHPRTAEEVRSALARWERETGEKIARR